MKRIIGTLGVIFIVIFCYSQYQYPPPSKGKIKINYKIREFIVNDSIFLNRLDSFVFQKKCESITKSQEGFFAMEIVKDDLHSCFTIKLEFYDFPSIHENAFGFFNHKNHTFILYGDSLPIFCKTDKLKKFSFERNIIPNIQDFPFWKIQYVAEDYILVFCDCW